MAAILSRVRRIMVMLPLYVAISVSGIGNTVAFIAHHSHYQQK